MSGYVDINKGFRRLGSFPLEPDSVFKDYASALNYANAGAYGGTAYVGKMVTVLPNDQSSDTKIYTVTKTYGLLSVVDDITTANTKVSASFDYNAASGDALLVLPPNYVVGSISVHIEEGFPEGTEIGFGTFAYDEKGMISGDEYLVSPEDMLADEDDSDFLLSVGFTTTDQTAIRIFVKNLDSTLKRGQGTLKLN
jgi:hypothetical protein